MKKLSEVITVEFKYDSEEERSKHIEEMEAQGYTNSGQVKKSDDSLMCENPTYYWYGKFGKIIS